VSRQFKVDKEKVKSILDKITQEGRKNVLEEEGYGVLTSYGFSTPKSILGTTEEECAKAANQIGYPVVMKIASPDIIHKSDAGGVKVGIKSEKELRLAFKEIMNSAKAYKAEARIKGVLVQEMITSAKEIILGAKQDQLFGPLVMVGLGGIYVEVLKDVVFRLAPIDEQEAEKMVDSIKAIKLLKGIRGEAPSDLAAVVDSLQRLSQLITDFPEIEEFDINPLLVLESGKGVRVADVRIGLKR
jgi:4-hydroxybutyrate---CoA ligase (ADP-forming)